VVDYVRVYADADRLLRRQQYDPRSTENRIR